MKLSKKLALVAGTTAVAVAGAGVAYAFWTTGGSGTGTASTGTAAGVSVVGTVTSALVPDGAEHALSLAITNPNKFTVSLDGKTASISNVTCTKGTTTVNAGSGWFTIVDSSISEATPASASDGTTDGTGTAGGITVAMNDNVANQDACQNANVAFDILAS